MTRNIRITLFIIYLISNSIDGKPQPINYFYALKDSLTNLVDKTSDIYLLKHFESMLQVVDAVSIPGEFDDLNAKTIYDRLYNSSSEYDATKLQTYTCRRLPFIIAWPSNTIYKTSFAWLTLPKNWEPNKSYPLYVQLHGLWDVAENPIEYMAYPYISPSSSFAFEDGYLINPWGLGNHWYLGDSEADIHNAIAYTKQLFSINESRQYLCGHSMGGYGAWRIGSKTVDMWAGLGIHAGALWYNNNQDVTYPVIVELSNTPVYFIVGNMDGLYYINLEAYYLLTQAGNTIVKFETFSGGHKYRQEDVEAMYLWLKQFQKDANPSAVKPQVNYHLNIYPNPVNDHLIIEYHALQDWLVEINLYNSNTQKITSRAFSGKTSIYDRIRMNLEGLPSGTYILQLKTYTQSIVKKIIIQ